MILKKIIFPLIPTIVSLFFLLFGPRSSSAQLDINNYQQLRVEDGLASDQYNSFIFKDSDGLVWIGSFSGLSRFDGLTVKVYPSGLLPGQLPENAIQSTFIEDHNKDLWFATQRYLVQYKRYADSFESYQLIDTDSSLINSGYSVIYFDKNSHVLWLKAGNKLWHYQINSGEYEQVATTLGRRFNALADTSGRLRKLLSCPWYDAKGVEYFKFPESLKDESVTKRAYLLNDLTIPTGIIQNESIAWISTEKGLGKYDLESGEILDLFSPEGTEASAPWGILRLNENQLLVAFPSNGLWIFDLEKQQLSTWINLEECSSSDWMPNDLYQDDEGYEWVNTADDGVLFFRFISILNNLNNNFDFPITNSVASIQELNTPEQEMLVFTVFDGVFSCKKDRDNEDGLWNVEYLGNPHPFTKLIHTFIDSENRCWILYRNGICVSSDNGRNWINIENLSEANFLYACELPDGRIIAGSDQGVLEVEIKEENKFKFKQCPEFSKYPNLQVTHFFAGASDDFFAVFEGREIWPCRLVDNQIIIEQKMDVSSQVFDIWAKPDTKDIWLATSAGLKMIEYSPTLDKYIEKERNLITDQLNAVAVYSILEDSEKGIWFTTDKGLWKKELDSDRLLRFWKEDGLPSEQYNFFAGLISKDGLGWLGTSEGLHLFDPESLAPYPYASNPLILDLILPEGPYNSDTVITKLDFIELTYKQNTLSFDIRAVTNFLAKENKITYRLKGYDDNWVTIKNGDIARFTKIPPGSYLLEYAALSGNGVLSDIKELKIKIKPPFYKTIWFRVLSILFLVGVAYFSIRAFFRKKIQEKELIIERQAALQSERNRIAGELHDDLGSGLSIIRFLSDELGIDEGDAEKREQISRIAVLSGGLVERMRDIIWALNTENDQLENLLLFLRRYAVSFLSDSKLDCKINFPVDIPDAEIKGERRRNVLLIFKEILHNVVKHASASQVEVLMKIQDDKISIEISDNGKGMPNEEVRIDANGLKNLRNRIHPDGGEIKWSSNSLGGTTVKLLEPIM